MRQVVKEGLKIMREMCMGNNLEQLIAKSRLTKKDVASLKGVTPETLSRHVNNKKELTSADATEYAKILNCSPQQVLYKTRPIDIIGKAHIGSNGFFDRKIYTKPKGRVYLHDFYQDSVACMTWTVDPDYKGPWQNWNNSMTIVRSKPIYNKYIDTDCFQNLSIIKSQKPVLLRNFNPKADNELTVDHFNGVLYPEPGNKYTVEASLYVHSDTENHFKPEEAVVRGLALVWATPIIATIFRPDLRGAVFEYD